MCLPEDTKDAATSKPYKKPQQAACKSKAKAFFNPNLSHKIEAVEVKVAEGDMGKIIGKQGRVAKAIRTVVKAAAIHEDKRIVVEIVQ